MRNTITNLIKDEAGTSMLEMALVTPLLLFLFFSAFDFGIAAQKYLNISRVAYEGARYGASIPGMELGRRDLSNIKDPNIHSRNHELLWERIDQIMYEKGIPIGDYNIISTYSSPGTSLNDSIEVTVSYDHFFLKSMGFAGFNTPASLRLSATFKAPYLGPI